MQAGDLLQDLKTGHCLGASPKVQFIGQLIGSAASIFITVCAYQLYDGLYTVPSEEFPAPVAHIWRDMAELLSDGIGVLPESALGFASIFSVGGVALAVMERLAQGAVESRRDLLLAQPASRWRGRGTGGASFFCACWSLRAYDADGSAGVSLRCGNYSESSA